MATTRGRLVQSNQVVYDQADFFQLDGFTRQAGLTIGQITFQVYFNNTLQAWTLVSGVGVLDPQIVAGKVYWHEIPGPNGPYSVRWRPNAVGYWRLLVTYPVGTQILAQDYDVISGGQVLGSGMKASFIGTGGKNDC
jgi:hypothetical protein